MLILYLINFRY